MKLRFRSVDGREVTKLEVPNPCTLRQLQRILLDHIYPSTPSSVRFSLNRKDELQASSGEDTLHSLGVTSGDLLFYSLLPEVCQNPTSSNPERIESGGDSKNPGDFLSGNVVNTDISQGIRGFNSLGSVSGADPDDSAPSVREHEGVDSADLDSRDDGADGDSFLSSKDMDLDVDDSVAVCSNFSGPYFLRRVLTKEFRENEGSGDRRILVLAVHAVMLESGFVAIDPATKMSVDGFHLPERWLSLVFPMSLHYSFPEILPGDSNSIESIFLRFHTLGQFMNVYGSLDSSKSDLRRVCLNGSVLSPKIDSVSSSCNCDEAKGVFEFFKIIKDNLALPLSIDLSDRAGLLLPSCFARLPMELKAKILDSLSGVDLAKVGCVCSELHYLSANNDLWKQKCIEEFRERVVTDHSAASRAEAVNWKQVFLRSWKEKMMKRELQAWSLISAPRLVPAFNRIMRDPRPFGAPRIIGGDYDRLPVLGIQNPHGGRVFRMESFQDGRVSSLQSGTSRRPNKAFAYSSNFERRLSEQVRGSGR